MRTFNDHSMRSASIVLILLCAIFFTGCTSTAPISTAPTVTSPPLQITPTTPQIQTFQTTEKASVTTVTTNKQVITTIANLPYGIIISYPQDWEKKELSEIGLRDYGRTAINIANFFSPDITYERMRDTGSNPDISMYTTLSIDVDQNYVSDFEQYFNLVVLALQERYGHIEITKHNYQLEISGYDSYRLDFDTINMRGTYIFTDVDGTVYIFSFKNPSPYSSEVENMYKSIKIIPPITQKSR